MEVTVFLNLEIHGHSEGKIYLRLSLGISRYTSQKLEQTVELIQVDELTFSPQSKSHPAVTCQWLDLSAQVL